MEGINFVINKSVDLLKSSILNYQDYNFRLDCNLLAMKALNCSRVELIIKGNNYFDEDQLDNYLGMVNERIKLKPIQYILGECEFMSLNFIVNENVLIPRPDTEILVEAAIDYIKKSGIKKIVEIGTGSGCISISLAKYCKPLELDIIAIDISEKALEIAKINAVNNGVSDNITFLKSDMFDKLESSFGNNIDLIISNPPYIPRETCNKLDKNVIDFEPILALDGGIDGLDFYRKITNESKTYLTNKGILFYEIGYDQGKYVSDMLKDNNFINICCLKDYSNNDRVVFGEINL